MNISRNWLGALVETDLTAPQLRDLITERCAPVDEIIALRADLEPIVIARVVSAEKHPDSDRLSVTKVDAGGGELLDVVCGAPNVTAGKLYPFAPTGTVMSGGLKIERRKIRGAVSNGMLCSARELGLGENHEGIMELDIEAEPGTPFLRAVPVGDSRIVVDVTPNRPDLLSHLGIAREISAATGRELRLPTFEGASPAAVAAVTTVAAEGRAGSITVRVEDPTGAPRYMGLLIRGLAVRESPAWLVARVQSIGGRSINNVVDATNYILHELGQPIHAFDASKLGGATVVVRKARAGERVTTLDGVDRALDDSITVIADGERPQAIAGVMGGVHSEVTTSTTDVFLEVANFESRGIRATRRRLGMSTDASYRFERGVDPLITGLALARAVQLITAVAGGSLEGAPVDIRSVPYEPRSIRLRPSRVSSLLGESFTEDTIHALLASVGFELSGTPMTLNASDALFFVVPSWRPDVTIEADLIEEVARLHGYNRFSSELRPYRLGTVPESPLAISTHRIRDALVGAGLHEVRPLPFVAGSDETHVRVLNPIAENEAHLRRDVLATLARRVEYNLAHMQRSVRLFEIGDVFAPRGKGLPAEEMHVGAIIMGERHPVHFTEPRPPAFDEWDAKALAERMAQLVYPQGSASLEVSEAEGVLWTVRVDRTEVGVVRLMQLDAPAWASPAYGIEIRIAEMDATPVAGRGESARRPGESARRAGDTPATQMPAVRFGGEAITIVTARLYKAIPTTPAVEIDLALVVPDSVAASQVEAAVRDSAGAQLERLQLFDEFRGGDVPAGHRSLAWRLTFRHPERTLGAKEIDGRRDKILRTLDKTLGIRQRSA